MDKCGYDLKIFENQKVIQDYLCSLCLGVLNNPVSTPKGCEFCENCVLEWISEHKKSQFQCPACLDENITGDKLYISRRSRHQIDSFETHCSNASNVIPCHWKGTKAQHAAHMNICPVALVPCNCQTDGCGGNVLRRDVETHKKIASLSNQLANPMDPRTFNAFGCSISKSVVDSSIYCGEWKDGAKHGQGLLKYSQNCWYQGEWVYDKMDGFGVMQTADGRYTGQVVNGLRHGQGAMVYTDGQVCCGQWNQDKFVVCLSTDQSTTGIAGVVVDAVEAPVDRPQIRHSGLTPTFAALASATSENSLGSAAGTSVMSDNTNSSSNSDSSKRATSSTNVGASREADGFILYGEGHSPVRLSHNKNDSSNRFCEIGPLSFSPGSSIGDDRSQSNISGGVHGDKVSNRDDVSDNDDDDATQSSGEERCPYRLRTDVRTYLETYISKKTATRTLSAAAGSVGAASILVSPSAAASASAGGQAERDTSLDCLNDWSVGGSDDNVQKSGTGVAFGLVRRIDPLAHRGTHQISRSRVVGTKRQLERSTNGNSALLNSGNSSTGTYNHTNVVKRPALSLIWAADASNGAKWGSRRSSDMSWREDDELFEPATTRSTAVRVTEDRRPHVTTTTLRKSTASYINNKSGMYTATSPTSLQGPSSRNTRSSSKRRPTIPVSAVKSANFVDLVDEWESWESD